MGRFIQQPKFIQNVFNFGDDMLERDVESNPRFYGITNQKMREAITADFTRKRIEIARNTPITNSTPVSSLPYSIGDVLIYPMHGIVRVVDIRDEKWGGADGETTRCYILKIDIKTSCDKPLIKLPVTKAEANHIKPIIKRGGQTAEILAILGEEPGPADKRSWNKRCVEYQQRMMGGDFKEVAAVFRDIVRLKNRKQLSHTEQRLFDQGKGLIIKALAIALDVDEKEMYERVITIINSVFKEQEV